MKTTQQTIADRRSRASLKSESPLRGQMLTGQALLDDMEAYRKEITATPESARAFLVRLGVLTTSGKRKQLIRD